MRRAIRFITGKEWAVVVAVVSAILVELPALADAVQGQLSGQWSASGLIIVVAGFVIRSKVWSAASHQPVADQLADTRQQLGEAERSVDTKDTQVRSLRLLLRAQQRGEITQFESDPLPGWVADPVTFVNHQRNTTGGLGPGLPHPDA